MTYGLPVLSKMFMATPCESVNADAASMTSWSSDGFPYMSPQFLPRGAAAAAGSGGGGSGL